MTRVSAKIDRDLLLEYTDLGFTDSRIAELMDVSQPSIHYARTRFGITSKRAFKQSIHDIDAVRKLSLEKSKPEIAEELGIPYQTIVWICNKYDISTVKKRRTK